MYILFFLISLIYSNISKICFYFQGGPRLKGQDLVAHFLKVIKESRYSCLIGVEYCKLLKNILSIPVYRSDVRVETWQGTSYDLLKSWRIYNMCDSKGIILKVKAKKLQRKTTQSSLCIAQIPCPLDS